MATKYAKDQPTGFSNRITRVAIVGAGGSVGKHITTELLKTGLHTVTALTRIDSPSKSKIPPGTKIAPIDYDDEPSIVSALQGQQFLIITLSVLAPADQHSKLVRAAAHAGVPYVMPNHYGGDMENKALAQETMTGDQSRARIAEIESTGVSSWIALACSFWYEFSLVMGPEWYGFDFGSKTLTFYDDGRTRINTSTWEQCGRALAALLSLKELPEDEHDSGVTLSNWRNKPLYISSFLLSQREMFESWKRVSGDRDEDWTVAYQPTGERYAQGLQRLKAGERRGLAQAMYSRMFFPNGDGNYEAKYGLANGVLGLPKEDLDERTKIAKKMLDEGWSYF